MLAFGWQDPTAAGCGDHELLWLHRNRTLICWANQLGWLQSDPLSSGQFVGFVASHSVWFGSRRVYIYIICQSFCNHPTIHQSNLVMICRVVLELDSESLKIDWTTSDSSNIQLIIEKCLEWLGCSHSLSFG